MPTKLNAFIALAVVCLLSSCAEMGDRRNSAVISVKDQQMLLLEDGIPVKTYPISTSKFGLGSQQGSMRTPLGRMQVAKKIGTGAPQGAVFKSRKRTGEILKPNAPGRDPIVTRILWLHGKERHNRNTFSRYIYIHGTPEERYLGYPVSYGCIRMKSSDVKDLYSQLAVGSDITIINQSFRPQSTSESMASEPSADKRRTQSNS